MNNRNHQKIEPAFDDTSSDFDHVLMVPPTTLDVLPIRLKLKGKVVNLNQDNEYAVHIYKVITSVLISEWHQSLGLNSALSYENQLFQFIPWLNKQSLNLTNRYSVLKDYETYRVNENGIKPQSTGLSAILNLLEHGIHADNLAHEIVQYVTFLIKNTNVSVSDERESATLSSYFASMPWLRKVLGEKNYLSLESPKRLIDSFSIIVATTLLFILDTKKEAKKRLSEPIKLNPERPERSKYIIQYEYCLNLLNHLGQLTSSGQPADNLTELILLDYIPADRRDDFLEKWHKWSGESKFNYRGSSTRSSFFTNAEIFSPMNWSYPSRIEQLLFAWLCAWQTVQPFDVVKLKHNDFVITKNNLGRPVSLQIRYYKGRSGRTLEPPMLDARQIEARAMLAYLEQTSEFDSNLCNLRPITLAFSANSIPSRLARLFNSPIIKYKIDQNLKHRESSPLFLEAFNSIANQNETTFGKWRQMKQELDVSAQTYRTEIENPYPLLLFNLSSIKNSAVHAKSDRYRDGDLLNQNSHTSQTEKISYLTDANKDWVNQNGRITRMVLDDIANYVYQPNIQSALREAQDMTLRSRVIQATGDITHAGSIQINTLGQINDLNLKFDELDIYPNDIIVLDTPETVVNMLHYINQAKCKQHLLITHAILFFELTVLPTVEWMQTLIQEQLSPKSIRAGQSSYEEIKTILPVLFLNELRAGVGA